MPEMTRQGGSVSFETGPGQTLYKLKLMDLVTNHSLIIEPGLAEHH